MSSWLASFRVEMSWFGSLGTLLWIQAFQVRKLFVERLLARPVLRLT
jgi:hypothetical protein